MKKWALISALLIMIPFGSLYADQEKESQAIKAAGSWLYLVDGEKYKESWENTSEYFKNAVSKNKWKKSLDAFRKPLGSVVSRKLVLKQYTTSLPGAPDGEYVVIQYETTFRNKTVSIETVTPSLEKNGEWKVAGYYIK